MKLTEHFNALSSFVSAAYRKSKALCQQHSRLSVVGYKFLARSQQVSFLIKIARGNVYQWLSCDELIVDRKLQDTLSVEDNNLIRMAQAYPEKFHYELYEQYKIIATSTNRAQQKFTLLAESTGICFEKPLSDILDMQMLTNSFNSDDMYLLAYAAGRADVIREQLEINQIKCSSLKH